jgi:hypothetical protein
LTIIPIFRREMVAAARLGKVQSLRAYFAGQLLVVVVGSFAAWFYWSGGVMSSGTMMRVATESLRWGLLIHFAVFNVVAMSGARVIAKERDRRTLDFLLASRLTAAEIVLGKLVSCLLITAAMFAAGLPIMVLMHVLGGVDARLILMAYAGLTTSVLFASALAVWVSVEIPDSKTAVALFTLALLAWMIGPFCLGVFLPRWGIRLPEWLAAANWGLVGTSPVAIAFQLALGLPSRAQLFRILVQMMALQVAGTAILTALAILRLRPAHRAIAGFDRQARRKARRRLVWRLRPRPPVGDEPILWREMYTSRESGLIKAFTWFIFGGLMIGLAAGMFYYARPAFVELWRHGYASAATAAGDLDRNVLGRIFLPRPGPGAPLDQARVDFNLFIRFATVAIVLTLSFLTGGIASEVCSMERLKDTWGSLLATPLEPCAIVRSFLLAAAWRSRFVFGALAVLWTLGLAAGAIHPLGYLVSLLELAASVGMMAVLAVLGAIRTEKAEVGAGLGSLLAITLTMTGALPLFLPIGLNSVLWGAGSAPLMVWTSLVSYREVTAALASPLDPNFQWFGGQRPVLVFTAWLVAIVGPALIGLWTWRYTIRHFDRLVGRPHRAGDAVGADVESPSAEPPIPRPAATFARRGSPLAEADGAV